MEKKNEQQVFETYIKNLFDEKDKPTTEELTQWGWNFKIDSALQIDLIDVETDTVKVRYLGKEFRVTMIDNELFEEIFETIKNILYTTLLLNCDEMKEEERQELLFKFTRFKTCLKEQYFRGKENYNKVIELARKGPVINSPSDFKDFKFPTDIPGTANPTYVFNNISSEDAERIIKKVISSGGGNIKINFADKK